MSHLTVKRYNNVTYSFSFLAIVSVELFLQQMLKVLNVTL